MDPKIVYPIPKSQSRFFRILRFVMSILFLTAALTCLIVNFFVGGKWWSMIVLWSLIMVWRLIFSPRLVEFSLFAHIARTYFYVVVLLILIDRFLAPGWAETVIPIVSFGALLTMAIVYYAIYDRKSRHIMSVFVFGVFSILLIPYSLHSWPITNWIAFAFALASFVLFLVNVIINRKEILYELKTRFRV